MNKTNRFLVVALVIQVALIMGMRLGGDRALSVEHIRLLDRLDADKVTRLQIWGAPQEKADDPPQNSVDLKKEGATWGLTNADGYPGNSSNVKTLLRKLASLRSHTRVLSQSTYHDKLEVSEKKYQRKVILTEDGKARTFYIGSSPSFKNLHFRVDGSDDVYLVNDLSTSDVGDRAWNWVDRDYVKFSKDDVWSVKIKNEKGSIELEKTPQDGAWVSASVGQPLDTSTVDDLVKKASSMSLETPMGKTEKPEYGLDAPLATIELMVGTSTVSGAPPPSTTPHTIRIGKKLEKEDRYYVKASGSEYVVQVAGWAISPLVEKGPKDLVKSDK